MSLYSRLDRIAADVEKLNRQVTAVANAPQSQRTSVEGGSIDFNDADGNLKAIVGMQDDGGYTTNVVSGPTPPTPANFTVEVDHGKIVVHWDGTFENALVAPTDWARAEVYAQEGQFVTPSRELARGSMVAASGGEVTIGVLKGQWTVCMAGWSQAGIMSPMSAPITVDVPGYGDIVLAEIDAAETDIKNAREVLLDGQNTLGEKLDAADTALSDLETTMGELDSTTLPALRNDLDAAEGRLDTAEGQITDAFGQIESFEVGAVNLVNKSDMVRGMGSARFLELAVWRAFEGNVGRKVTLSFDLVANADNLQVRVYPYLNSGVSIETTTNVSASTSWQRFTVSTVVADYGTGSNRGSVGFYSELASGLIEIRNVKVEWGSKASAYSPSPADVGADIDSAEQSAESAAKSYADGLKTQIDSTIDTVRTELEGDITTAQSTATQALTSANAKNKVTRSTSRPPAVYDGRVDDVWFTMSSMGSGGRVLFQEMWNGTTWVSVTIDSQVIAYLDAAKITTGYLDVAALIKAGAIAASQIAVGDFSNLASVDPIRGINVTRPAYWATKTVGDYATRGDSANNYLMFKDRTDTVPFTNGEALRMTFTAKATVPTDVGGALWAYPTDSNGPGSGSRSVTGDFVSVGETEQNFTIKIDIPNNWADVIYKSWICGLFPRANTGGDMANVLVRDVRVYRMTGTTLIQNGAVTTDKVAANVLEVGNLKAGTAAIAEAVVAKIAASTASIQQADVKNLFVTGTSSLSDVVAERIAAETAEFIQLEVGNLVAGTGTMDTATINKLFSDVVVASMAQAEQFIGENAILTGAVTAPKITASEELWAKIAQFVKIRAEHIEADAIDGMVITGPTIQSGRSGRRWIGDPNGIRIINEDDDVRTQLSPDGSTFKGEVEADTLVVNEGAEFKGNNTLAQGAIFTLAAGVTDPTAPPVVQPYWEGVEFTPPSEATTVGLAFDGTHYWTAEEWPKVGVAWKINADTGGAEKVSLPGSWGRLLGVTCIGSELYWLTLANYTSKVMVTDLNLTKKREWEYPELNYSPTNPLTYKPGIGNDGTNIVIAHCFDAGHLGIYTYNKTTGTLISLVRDTSDSTKSDITGVYVGNADWGRKLVTVAKKSSGDLPSFNPTSGVYDGAVTKFDAASPDSTGVVYVDGKWRTLDPSGIIHEYADPNTGDNSGDWWATYYWYTDVDNDNIIESTDYRSRMAPPARFAWPRRAMLKILGQPMPTGVEALGPALAKKTSTPTRTDFHGPSWQVDTGKPSARYTELPTNWATFASPSATNTFPEATSSVVESASGTFQVKGDGSGHWGPLTMGRNGIMSGLIVSGQTLAYVDTPDVPKKFTIQLPPGRFTKPPVVWVQSSTTVPNIVSVSVIREEITTTTFNMYFNRSGLVNTGVTWFAMDSE